MQLFEQAMKNAPCLIFVDEVESLATQTGKDDNKTRDNICHHFLKNTCTSPRTSVQCIPFMYLNENRDRLFGIVRIKDKIIDYHP